MASDAERSLDEREAQAGGESGSPGATRRTLVTLASAAAAFLAGLGVMPAIRFLRSPALDAEAGSNQTHIVLPGAAALAPGDHMLFAFNGAPTLLIRHPDDEWVCFRAVCTHLACTVRFDPGSGRILCACHEGVFDSRSGAALEGPPPEGLQVFNVEVREDDVVVSVA